MSDLVALSNLVEEYGLNKAKLDEYDKFCKSTNAEIKKIMKDENITEAFGDTYKVKYTIQHRESMNEDRLLQIAHIYGISEIVKTKEYIDFDVLEDAIYNNRIPSEVLVEMNKAKEVKEVETLKVSPIKKKGKE